MVTLYRKVCRQYLDRFVDHHASTGCPQTSWVLETVDFIEAEFGAALHPAFLDWRARASTDAASGEAVINKEGTCQSGERTRSWVAGT
jgi:hypothetical protein